MTARQQRFVSEYLIDLNATQAAIRAGYSKKAARSAGSELLTNPNVAAEVERRKAQQLERADLSAARVLEELRRLAFSDVGAIFNESGRLLSLRELAPEVRAAIASVKATKKNLASGDGVVDDIVEVRMWDKVRSLESLCKHFGLLTERIEHGGALVIQHELGTDTTDSDPV